MALNIKNQKTCDLARELADLTDDTMTGAITIALERQIEQVKEGRGDDDLALRLLAIGERCAKSMGPGPSSAEIVDSLYGEFGEPV